MDKFIEFEKIVFSGLLWAKENKWRIDAIPFIDKKNNKCSPLGAVLLQNNIDVCDSVDGNILLNSKTNYINFNKIFPCSEQEIDSFLLGLYMCPKEHRYIEIIESFYILGKEITESIKVK